MEFPYAELHAFPDGDRPHSGNPAGVVLLHRPVDDANLLGLAQSNNLSETAYLIAKAPDLWDLRWFTPALEVDLCGHATLAAAGWLFQTGRVGGEVAQFDTRSGRLEVRQQAGGGLVMDFPHVPYQPTDPVADVVQALGAGAPVEAFELERIHGDRYQMLVFADETVVADMRPDFGALARSAVNTLVTAPGRSSDFVSRFFCPAAGVNEDPVTGSAHCSLAPYWFERLGRTELSARQIGPRPGALQVRAGAAGRIMLVGRAARYLDGVIRL